MLKEIANNCENHLIGESALSKLKIYEYLMHELHVIFKFNTQHDYLILLRTFTFDENSQESINLPLNCELIPLPLT